MRPPSWRAPAPADTPALDACHPPRSIFWPARFAGSSSSLVPANSSVQQQATNSLCTTRAQDCKQKVEYDIQRNTLLHSRQTNQFPQLVQGIRRDTGDRADTHGRVATALAVPERDEQAAWVHSNVEDAGNLGTVVQAEAPQKVSALLVGALKGG